MAVVSPCRTVILGVNGQDGSILAEHLLARGDTVLGIGRQASSRYVQAQRGFSYLAIDLRDSVALDQALTTFAPDQVYHLAAVHGATGFPYEEVWGDALSVNVGTVHTVLEHARRRNPQLRFGYASSAKVFGTPLVGTIGPKTPKRSECLYSITKNCAEDLLHYYWENHGIYGAVAYLFNHESERRNRQYFIPTIVDILTQAKLDSDYRQPIRTLDFYCDWGSAHEYMSWFSDLLDIDAPQRLIFATGVVHYGQRFVTELFERHGLDANRHVVEENTHRFSEPFAVQTELTQEILGRKPETDIFAVCERIAKRIPDTKNVIG